MLQSIMICMRLCLYYIIFEWVYQLMSIITRHYDLITLYGCFCNALQTFCKMLPCEKHFAKYYKYKLKKRKWRCQFVNCTEYSLLHRKGSCPVTDKSAWKTLFSCFTISHSRVLLKHSLHFLVFVLVEFS